METFAPPKFANKDLAAAALVIFICLFGHLAALGLVGPDDTRYAWIARDMAASGDWVTPRLYGRPWFEKPALYYWSAALAFDLHLPAEWAARLPSAFAALIAAATIGWLAWKSHRSALIDLASPALLAPLLFSTSVAAIAFARAAGPDMLFAASLTLAMAAAAAHLDRLGAWRQARESAPGSPPNHSALVLFGFFLALSVLAKGPAGVILAAGSLGIWALATGRWRAVFGLAHPTAIAVFCLVALPWYLLCAQRNPGFFRVFILEHNFGRYLTPMYRHPQPFWFFIPIVCLALLPWTALLWPAVQDAVRSWRQKTWRGSPGLFFACWAAFPILFFSLSQSKLPGYILPSIPPLVLVLALSLTKPPAHDPAAQRTIQLALAATWIAVAISAGFWTRRLPLSAQEHIAPSIHAVGLLLVAGGLAIAALAFWGKRGHVLLSLALVVLLVELAGWRILPALDPSLSARTYGEMLRNDRRPDRVFTYRLSRSWSFGLSFYLHREVTEWSPADPEPALVLTTPEGARELAARNRFRSPVESSGSGILFVPVLPAPR